MHVVLHQYKFQWCTFSCTNTHSNDVPTPRPTFTSVMHIVLPQYTFQWCTFFCTNTHSNDALSPVPLHILMLYFVMCQCTFLWCTFSCINTRSNDVLSDVQMFLLSKFKSPCGQCSVFDSRLCKQRIICITAIFSVRVLNNNLSFIAKNSVILFYFKNSIELNW